jgi:hypothetical protein
MNLNMYMVFVKQFNIMGTEQRKPSEKNNLERKRLGIIDKIEEEYVSCNIC